MTLKWIGALFIIGGCGGLGFGIAFGYQREVRIMTQLIRILEYMECELEYRLTPLPQLCTEISRQTTGCLSRVYLQLSRELESQVSPDAGCCMIAALGRVSDLPASARRMLMVLGTSLGRFDLSGQLKGIGAVKVQCQSELEYLNTQRESRVKSCKTLGICGGIALAILFI